MQTCNACLQMYMYVFCIHMTNKVRCSLPIFTTERSVISTRKFPFYMQIGDKVPVKREHLLPQQKKKLVESILDLHLFNHLHYGTKCSHAWDMNVTDKSIVNQELIPSVFFCCVSVPQAITPAAFDYVVISN